MKAELEAYSKSQQSERTLAQLWDMHYILESNLHPETRQPVAKLFRWSAYCPVNIPIIIGLSVLPPTPFNQIFFQTVNQSYNFGINFSNSTSSNQKSPAELAVSFSLAVGSAICGSVGLRKLLERRNLSSRAGRLLLQSTPLVGLVIANSVNLLFSRSGEVLQGIAVNSPLTGEKIPGVKSQVAGRRALLEGLLLRVAIPAPSFFLPLYASLLAKKRFRFYQRSALARLFYDGAVAYFTIWASLVFAMSFVEPNGRIRLADLEPAVAEKLPGLAPDTLISFSKGL
jgi:hypothetical protein